MEIINESVEHASAVADLCNTKAQDQASWWYGWRQRRMSLHQIAPTRTTEPHRARKNREATNPQQVASFAPLCTATVRIASHCTRRKQKHAR